MKGKKLLAGFLASALFLIAAGCGSPPANSDKTEKNGNTGSSKAEEIVLHYPSQQVGVNTAAPVLKENVKRFNEKFQGKYKIVVEEIPGDQNYVDKMKTLMTQNSLPPVVYGAGYNLLDLALAQHAVVDLTPYVEKDSEWKAMYNEAAMRVNARDGKIYASSSEGNTIGYFYNKEIFKKAGISKPAETWDELWDQAKKIKALCIAPFAMDTADSAWVTSLWLGAMVGTADEAGFKFMQKSMPTDYMLPEFVNAVANIQKMYKEWSTPDAIGGKYENAANNFMNGQAAMMANGPWMINDFSDKSKAPEGFADKVGVAVYPGSFVYDEPIQGMFVTTQKDPKQLEAAVEMVKFFTDKAAQTRALEMQGMVPASSEVSLTDSAKQKYPLLVDFLDQVHGVKLHSANTQSTMFPNLLDVMSQELPQLASGNLSAQDFCQKLSDAAKKNQ